MLRFNLLALAMLSVLSYLSLLLKAEVENIKDEYILINTKIDSELETIKLLRAELVHLQSPTRIKNLANKYLKLKTISTSQLVIDPTRANNINKTKYHSIKTANRITWRYKKSPYTTQKNNQIHRASHSPGK